MKPAAHRRLMETARLAIDRWAVRRTMGLLIQHTDDVSHSHWLGQPVWQYPQDAWLLQEMIGELRPDVFLETGTWRGGSALFVAMLFDQLGHGHVISVDIAAQETPAHPRVTYIDGNSVDGGVVERARALASSHGENVFVMLDSDHAAAHVLTELRAYADLVPVGGYVHVQDGCIDELPQFRSAPAGPSKAVQSFLAENDSFIRDAEVEGRYVMTAHPYGWLRRVA